MIKFCQVKAKIVFEFSEYPEYQCSVVSQRYFINFEEELYTYSRFI